MQLVSLLLKKWSERPANPCVIASSNSKTWLQLELWQVVQSIHFAATANNASDCSSNIHRALVGIMGT